MTRLRDAAGLLVTLGFAGLSFALAQTMLVPALPQMVAALDTTPGAAAWTLTANLASAAVCTPILGRLGDMFGKRRMLIIALSTFSAGSVISALGPSLAIVTVGRIVQGAGAGVFPLCYGIVRDELDPGIVARGIGAVSATIGGGAGLGLLLGGLIVDIASFRWMFWTGAAIAALAALCAARWVPPSPHRSPGRVDVGGAALMGVGITALLIAVARAQTSGWAQPDTLGLLAAAALTAWIWVRFEQRRSEPLVDVDSLRQPTVLLANAATLLIGFGMFGAFILTPQLAQAAQSTGYGLGLRATGAGLIMLPGAVAMLVMGPVSGAVGARLGARVPLAIGAALTSAGLVASALQHSSIAAILVFHIVLSAGIGMSFAAMPNVIVEVVPLDRTGEATGFNALVRVLGSAIGGQASAALLAGSVVAGLPTDAGFTAGYALGAGVAAAAAVTALLIPARYPVVELRPV